MVPLHLPVTAPSLGNDERIAGCIFVRFAVHVRQNELAAQYVDELIDGERRPGLIRLGRRGFENDNVQLLAAERGAPLRIDFSGHHQLVGYRRGAGHETDTGHLVWRDACRP